MSIRIERNEAGNCINFHGSSNPTYWNACLSAEIDSTDSNAVNVINDVITAQTGVTQYEFFRIPYTEFTDASGNSFATAQDAADYITANANVLGIGTGIDLIGQTVCFKLDATSTSIMLDNGYSYGVNTIKAVADSDGTIHIKSKLADLDLFYNLQHTLVCVNDSVVTGGLNDVVNTLNELFTVGAFQSVVIADPYSTMVADVSGVNATMSVLGTGGIDPIGDDVFGASAAGSLNGYKSTEVIDQAGEYFTFDIRNESQIGFGLVHSDASYAAGNYSGNATYADPANFGVFNSAHGGFQFSHWFHPTPNGSWTNYGANTGYVQGEAWYNSNTHFEGRDEWLAGTPIKIKVGIDENGFIAISSLADDGVTWKLHARTNYPVPQGSEFHLGIKCGDTTGRVYTLPKVHLLEPAAPTMYFRYAESPDGVFKFPLFATAEEAEYYDTVEGGSGTYTTLMLPDDPTNTLWHAPDTEYTGNGIAAPVGVTFEGNFVNYTEITTLTNADLVPPAFTAATLTIDELASINYQTQPQDTAYTTTFSGLEGVLDSIIDAGGGILSGTAPEVTGDNVANPSDTYTIGVHRTNSYGTSNGTLTLNVANLTAPVVTAITGFTHNASSTALVDSSTMDSGSVVDMDESLLDLERLVILDSFVETNVLPSLQQAGDKYYMGVLNSGADISSVEDADWDVAFVWEYQTATTHQYRVIKDGVQQHQVGIGSRTVALFDYAIEVHNGNLYMIACNVNSINTEPSPAYGGSFTNATLVALGESSPLTISLAYVGSSDAAFSETDLSEIVTPALDNWIQLTGNPSHVLNFDGSTTMPTLQAGYTYRFLMGDTQYADLSSPTGLHVDDDLRFTADGSTEYTTGITRVGNPNDLDTFGAHTGYVEFVVPSDVPPLQWYTDHNGIGSATGLSISGSTYVVPITGVTQEGLAANQTGTNIMDAGDYGWISIDEQLSAGERLVLDNAFFTDFLAETKDTNNIFAIGLKGDNWTNTKEVNNSQAATSGEFFKGNTYLVGVWDSGGNAVTMTLISNGSVGNSMYVNTVSLQETVCAFLEITTSGNNIRAGFGRNNSTGNITQGDESTVTYADWNAYKGETGDQGYGISSIDVVMSFWTFGGGAIDGNNIDWTLLNEVNIPTPAVTNQTPWTKALDFSGNAERAQQVTNDSNRIPMKMGGTNNQVLAPSPGQTVASGHPWATVIVFNADVYNSNQHIWNLGEGAGTTDDNIYLRRSSDRRLYFGWGRDGDKAECEIIDLSSNMSTWHAIYIAHNGTRYGSNNTTSLMAEAFDIRHARASGSWTLSSNLSVASSWTITGDGRMNRQYQGDMTIGGRGANRSFHGKVASYVSTTLRVGVAMPTTTEIEMMITDPMKWLNDYKVGVDFRLPWQTTNSGFNFALNDGSSSYSTQVWLMGDGTNDSYSNMIRNQVQPADQNYTKLNLISMVSNDIENVNISGLS